MLPIRITLVSLAVCLGAFETQADDPKPAVRSITEADSVLAVYREDWGLASKGGPSIFFAAWPDGHLVWSEDRINGGAPYRAGKVDPKKITGLLARFEKDGLFAEKKLKDANFPPDGQFINMFIKSSKKQLEMRSSHELVEEDDRLVADHVGVRALEGQTRLEVLRKAPADFLFYRFVWSETRGKLNDLIPRESRESKGKPVMKAGILTWHEPAENPKSNGASSPSKK